jgi:sorbitol/mannitol transport system permease protein
MIVPLAMTLYYSFRLYRLLSPDRTGWVGFNNYVWFFNSPDFWLALFNTLALVGGVLIITVVLGILIALLIDQPVKGQGFLRILVIAPFFVMPPVAASIWENLFMHPQNGLFSAVSRALGYEPILYLEQYPMLSVIGIVSWEWLPFATLILLTALQSLSSEQLEAAEMDGASAFSRFRYIILPHMTRAITVVIHLRRDLHDHSRRAGFGLHHAALHDLQAGHRRQGHRARGGRRDHRGDPGEHRGLFPDARPWPEPGELTWPAPFPPAARGSPPPPPGSSPC